MKTIFDNILSNANNIERYFDSFNGKKSADIYALFISVLAYWNIIQISPLLANKLYIAVKGSHRKDMSAILDRINEFTFNTIIEDLEKELNG